MPISVTLIALCKAFLSRSSMTATLDTPSSLTATNTVCWIGKEMGSAVAALMRNYTDKVCLQLAEPATRIR